ncbi:helix-turn-helix domain-containing protein [Brassicibacter mesophilus]|uniref:helix-turn-helix domain-containing protein n=1 Tax=Brassicibacter mesophilus TaxID=745119 RepID=UPI003D218B39
MAIGANVRRIRNDRNISILKLRELTGLSKSTISDLENDKSSPTVETLQKIANALEVDVEDFFKSEQKNEENTKKWDNKKNSDTNLAKEAENIEFTTPEQAMKFILEQNVIMGFGGFDINKMSDEEVVEFANELLRQLKLLSYKYKK